MIVPVIGERIGPNIWLQMLDLSNVLVASRKQISAATFQKVGGALNRKCLGTHTAD